MKWTVISLTLFYLCLSCDTAEVHSNRYRRNSKTGCIPPPQPENGRWSYLTSDSESREGATDDDLVLHFECNTGYKLSSESPYLVCSDKLNSSDIPKCKKLCPPQHPTEKANITCFDRNRTEVECSKLTEDNIVLFTCAPLYEIPMGYPHDLFCSDGQWRPPKPLCQPVCGKNYKELTDLAAADDEKTEGIEYPWFAMIYRKEDDQYINSCGATIIGEKIVLTSATCVTNRIDEILPKENFIVAAGKLYKNYKDSRDHGAQYLKVSRIAVHPDYIGDNREVIADIAVLVTEEPFVINRAVRPICFREMDEIKLQRDAVGVVSTWGSTEGTPSDELRTIEIPSLQKPTCNRAFPSDIPKKFRIRDKISAGFTNSTAIRRGDAGNGLYIKNPKNGRYYIHGINSVNNIRFGPCGTDVVFTNVFYYYKFVLQELRFTEELCDLPAYPQNGKYVIENGKTPGDIVSPNTTMKYNCNKGYRLSSDDPLFKCGYTAPSPECLRTCPDPDLNDALSATCRNSDGETISCSEATDYSTLSYRCPYGYEIPDGGRRTIRCIDGSWESPMPECQPLNDENLIGENPEYDTKVVCVYDSRTYHGGIKPDNFNASLCTHVIYHYAGLSFSGNIVTLDGSSNVDGDKDLYDTVLDMKKQNGKLKVLLSISGIGTTTGGEFPTVAKDPFRRSKFVASITRLLETYPFDGIDIHWKYPLVGIDKVNYGILLQELRKSLNGNSKLLTATVYYSPVYMGYNISQMNINLDWINVKCYQLYDEFSKYTGQNSALFLSTLERSYEADNLNVKACASNWESYGIRKNKIVIAITFFGRYYTLKNSSKHGLHAAVTGSTNKNHTDLVSYSKICQDYTNWTRVWDNEQKNPYKYHEDKWVGYDDPSSIKMKAIYIKQKRYAGVGIFSIDADDVQGKCGPKQVLLNEVINGLNDSLENN